MPRNKKKDQKDTKDPIKLKVFILLQKSSTNCNLRTGTGQQGILKQKF
jgi:hypothetical protein